MRKSLLKVSFLAFMIVFFTSFILYFNLGFPLNDTPTLLFLPFLFFSIVAFLPALQTDFTVLTPRNVMLFVWFNKLVFIPFELLLMDNKALFFNPNNHVLSVEIWVLSAAFLAFVAGWQWGCKPTTWLTYELQSLPKMLATLYFTIGFGSLIWLYGSLEEYAVGALFTYITRDIMEQASGALMGYLANVGQRFLPFGVILAWCFWQQNRRVNWPQNAIWLGVCLLSTLSSNRANMVYPLLAFGSVMASGWQIKNKWPLLAIITAMTFSLFFFGYIRTQPWLDGQQVANLFAAFSQTDYVFYAHQIYFGTPYQITPLLHLDAPAQATWWASLLDPVPILGKDFRSQSGVAVYNLAIYNSDQVQDKVIPVAGELFYNGGYATVIFGHLLFGWLYVKLDLLFKHYVKHAPALAIAWFYLALLFNATLLLSLSVLVQFLVYNAAPALLIVSWYYFDGRKNKAKA